VLVVKFVVIILFEEFMNRRWTGWTQMGRDEEESL
jgi:hypothetical protein